MDSDDRYKVDALLRSSTDFNFLQTYIFVDPQLIFYFHIWLKIIFLSNLMVASRTVHHE